MAYARWGQDGSDVYVFLNVSGWLECCGCGSGHWKHTTTDSMVQHLRGHAESGDYVPDDVFDRLEEKRERNDTYIAARQHDDR